MPRVVDHAARRLELSAVATRLIARGGLEAVTIREMARASGYSKGVVEHYFDNKQQLISGALDWVNHCYELRVARSTAGLKGLASLRERIAVTLPMTNAIRDEWKIRLVFWSLAAIDPLLRKRQGKRFQRAVDLFEGDINDAMVAGEIASQIDPAICARRLLHMTTGISTAALHNASLYNKAFLRAEVDNLLQQISTDW